MTPEDEGDAWGGDEVGTAAPQPPAQGVPVPFFEVPPVPLAPAADLVRGMLEVRHGRLAGRFEVVILSEGAAAVTVTGSVFAGKEHYGTVYFDQRGTVERRGSNYIRTRGQDNYPTDAALRALGDGAAEAVRQWIAAHPLAFEAADCLAAQTVATRAAAKVAELRRDLAKAEAEERMAALEHRERAAILAEKGVG